MKHPQRSIIPHFQRKVKSADFSNVFAKAKKHIFGVRYNRTPTKNRIFRKRFALTKEAGTCRPHAKAWGIQPVKIDERHPPLQSRLRNVNPADDLSIALPIGVFARDMGRIASGLDVARCINCP